MGSSQTKSQTKSNSNKMEQIKQDILNKRVDQIKNVKKEINPKQHHNDEMLDYITSNIKTPIDIAEEQVKRGGSNLTKPDLIAIIIALEPSQSLKIYQLNQLNVKDLNLIIRSIIYNPNRYYHHAETNYHHTETHLLPNSIPTNTTFEPLLIQNAESSIIPTAPQLID